MVIHSYLPILTGQCGHCPIVWWVHLLYWYLLLHCFLFSVWLIWQKFSIHHLQAETVSNTRSGGLECEMGTYLSTAQLDYWPPYVLFCRYIIFQPNKSFLSALAVVSFFLEITLFLLDGHKNIINYCTRHFLIFWKVSNGPLNEGMTLYFPTKQSANLSSLSKFIFIFFSEGHSPLECLFLCHCL